MHCERKFEQNLFVLNCFPKNLPSGKCRICMRPSWEKNWITGISERKIKPLEFLIPLAEKEKEVNHKPAQLYQI